MWRCLHNDPVVEFLRRDVAEFPVCDTGLLVFPFRLGFTLYLRRPDGVQTENRAPHYTSCRLWQAGPDREPIPL
jgi:hypothetical protein